MQTPRNANLTLVGAAIVLRSEGGACRRTTVAVSDPLAALWKLRGTWWAEEGAGGGGVVREEVEVCVVFFEDEAAEGFFVGSARAGCQWDV